MSISELRKQVSESVSAFAWSQWAQMGVLASADRKDRWAIDPEALLLFTLEIGRDEPRLFDELLDWFVVNERMISVQRLRNLARDDFDRCLADAALAWVSHLRPRARLVGGEKRQINVAASEPLFRGARIGVKDADGAFAAHGLLKPATTPTGHSSPADPILPVNFAFRLRHLLGVGARAEVVRVLLGTDARRMSVQAVAEAAGYAKRNVHEALGSLRAADVVVMAVVGNEQHYSAVHERWATLLGLSVDELPRHRDWNALLFAVRRIVRWLSDPQVTKSSDYMRASAARALIDELGPELRFAGVQVVDRGLSGADYWDDYVATVREALRALTKDR